MSERWVGKSTCGPVCAPTGLPAASSTPTDPPSGMRSGRGWSSESAFIGRKKELSELRQLLERTRVATVLGPPGVGKTRFVREYVRREEKAAAVYFCDLA